MDIDFPILKTDAIFFYLNIAYVFHLAHAWSWTFAFKFLQFSKCALVAVKVSFYNINIEFCLLQYSYL